MDRVYLGYQHQFTDAFSVKVLCDMGRSTGVSDLQRLMYVKNAFVSWKWKGLKIDAGLTGLKQFDLQEKYWGHRYVMKSFQDEYKFGSSADLGLVAQYQIGHWGSIDFSCVNGEGYKNIQLDNQLLYSAGLAVTPAEGLAFRIYGDYRGKQSPDSTETAQQNLSFFTGYKNKMVAVGAEYNRRFNSKNKTHMHQSGISAYASVKLPGNFELYARWDFLMSANNWNADNDGQLLLAGVQNTLCKHIKISPNFKLWMAAEDDRKVEPFLYLNLEAKL